MPVLEQGDWRLPPRLFETRFPQQIFYEDLRTGKKELKEVAEEACKTDFQTFKKRVNGSTQFVIQTLRDHISKENNILFPTALQVIPKEEWERMRVECDEIGYCCFTP